MPTPQAHQRGHAFDKLGVLDCTFWEFHIAREQAEGHPGEHPGGGSLNELLLLVEWKRPLHILFVVDDLPGEERVVTARTQSWPVVGLPSEALMRCDHCDQGHRQPVRRGKLAERDGKVAVVLQVPMEECQACGERWLPWDVARRLDELLTAILAGDVELGTRHFDITTLRRRSC